MMTKYNYTFLALLTVGMIILSCSDPRTAPATSPEPAHTESITLWQDAVSNGQVIDASFSVRQELAEIDQPGVDTPARLTIAAYIQPDNDINWYEKIVNDSIPAWNDPFIRYLVGIEGQQGIVDSVAGVRALCDTVPESCPDDTSGLIPAETAAMGIISLYQDSLETGQADTTRLGQARDSLGVVLDNRYTLALWMDSDTSTAFPDGLIDAEGRIGGQQFYLAATNGATSMKGRSFHIDLAQFEAADLHNPGRPIEINWTTCFIGSTRPCLSVGTHTLHARATGAVTKITAAIVLVYAEELR